MLAGSITGGEDTYKSAVTISILQCAKRIITILYLLINGHEVYTGLQLLCV